MVDISTTSAALIKPEWSDKVPSPAYDSLSPEQRRETRLANPWSFLNVTLSPEDVATRLNQPASQTPTHVSHEQLITLARESLDRITTAGAFAKPDNCLYLYRLQRGNHQQTALVTDVAASNYQDGQVKIHEQVKEARAELLSQHLTSLGVISSPIAMTYRNTDEIAMLLKSAQTAAPVLELGSQTGVHQTIWKITEPTIIEKLKEVFQPLPLYIIDGHHRAAATVAANKRSTAEHHTQLPLFSALFPHDELMLLGFNRWIKPDTKPVPVNDIMNLSGALEIAEFQAPQPGVLTIYADKKWIKLEFNSDSINDAENTDANLLQLRLLKPVYGIYPDDHSRIRNIPGNQPMHQLCETVDQHGGTAIFVAAMSIDQFLKVANSDDLLPPKSTYFTPKVQSGIFLRSTVT